jgi:hypothetical protein
MTQATPEVIAAIKHVRQYFPYVTMVAYNRFGQWQFMGDSYEQPTFMESIDVQICEDALDSIESLPCLFHFDEDELK